MWAKIITDANVNGEREISIVAIVCDIYLDGILDELLNSSQNEFSWSWGVGTDSLAIYRGYLKLAKSL